MAKPQKYFSTKITKYIVFVNTVKTHFPAKSSKPHFPPKPQNVRSHQNYKCIFLAKPGNNFFPQNLKKLFSRQNCKKKTCFRDKFAKMNFPAKTAKTHFPAKTTKMHFPAKTTKMRYPTKS